METRAAARRLAVSPAALAMLAAASAGWAAEAAGFAWRVELGKGWPVLSHNTQRLPLMAYRGETERVLAIELGEGQAPKAQLRGGWEHQRAEYALVGGKASMVVSRLTPAVLVESDGKTVTLRPAAPFGHVALVKGGKVAVAAGEPGGPPDEPWLLLWFGKGSPLRGRVTPFVVEDEHGVS